MEGGPGRLPRTTFMDDPFFDTKFDNFPQRDGFQRSPLPQRRFGSTPRLIDDDNDFFDDFRYKMPFGSLPRRHESRSPRPPTNRGEPFTKEGQERQIPVHITTTNGTSPNQSRNNSPPQQQQQPKKSPVPKAAIEINNANSNNYTNGELNPDRYQQPPAPDCPNPIIIKEVSLDPPKSKAEKRGSNSSTDSKKDDPIPLPPPSVNATVQEQPSSSSQAYSNEADKKDTKLISNGTNVGAKRQAFSGNRLKSMSIDNGASEQLIHLLDDAERGVEQLRDMASKLEEKKDSLLRLIKDVQTNASKYKLSEHDHEDILAIADRLFTRCRAVEVSVLTPRNETQQKALEEVTKLIDNVTNKMSDDLNSAYESILRFLNACCPDDEPGPIDQRFQSRVIECTADDQKKIRRKLKNILEDIDKAKMMCEQNY